MRLIDADKYCDFLNTYPLEKAQNNFMSFYREALQETLECEVKAIPIEWIEKWMLDNWVLDNYGIEQMIEDWEKENELDKVQ